jgi:hypothetical protein
MRPASTNDQYMEGKLMAFRNSSHGDDFDGATEGTTGRTVFAMFHERSDAERAIQALFDAGFTERDIGVAMRDRAEEKDLRETTGADAAHGAAAGAVSGGVVGGLIGLLGSLLIPGLGPIVVGGVLASTLTGAGVGAATGGIIGALVGAGASEEDARHFDAGFREGHTLVTVSGGTRVNEAIAILERHNADLGPSRSTLGTTDASERALGGTGAAMSGIGEGSLDHSTMSTGGSRDRDIPQEAYAFGGFEEPLPWGGSERRMRFDPSYDGPERRLAGV